MTESEKDENVRAMLKQLLDAREAAYNTGILEYDMVYILRNFGGERDHGSIFKNQQDCIDVIQATRPEFISEYSTSTYDVLIVDGSDWNNVLREVDLTEEMKRDDFFIDSSHPDRFVYWANVYEYNEMGDFREWLCTEEKIELVDIFQRHNSPIHVQQLTSHDDPSMGAA